MFINVTYRYYKVPGHNSFLVKYSFIIRASKMIQSCNLITTAALMAAIVLSISSYAESDQTRV